MLIRQFVGYSPGHHWHYLSSVCDVSDRYCFGWHYHPEFELTLTRNGSGTRYVGSDVEAFASDDLALVAPNRAHTWAMNHHIAGRPLQVQVIFFTLDWLRRLSLEGMPELLRFNQWLERVREGVIFSPQQVARLVPLFDTLDERQGLDRLAILLQILDTLPSDAEARHLGAGAYGSGRVVRDRRVDSALSYLQENYRDTIRLDDVAAAAATSVSTLKRLFQRILGLSTSDVLTQLRIGHACHLLLSTDYPVQRVATESGFNNQGHFFARFAAQQGCTPAEFRRRNEVLRLK